MLRGANSPANYLPVCLHFSVLFVPIFAHWPFLPILGLLFLDEGRYKQGHLFFPCLLHRFIQKKRKTPQHVWGCCLCETMGFCKRRDLVDLPNLRYDLFASKNKHAVVVLTLWFLEMGPGPNTSHLTDVSPPLKQGVSAGKKHWVTKRSRTFFGALVKNKTQWGTHICNP